MKNKIVNAIIVDDNKEFCELLKEFLSTQGDFTVSGICHNGKDALELIKRNSPDLIILDMIIPHLDGLGVLEKLASMNLKPKPFILVLSAVGLDSITQAALSLGADYYVLKPFEMDQLLMSIRRLLNNNEQNEDIESAKVLKKAEEHSSNNNNTPDFESQITDILLEAGMPANIRGFKYSRDAISLVINSRSYMESVTKKLYPELAEKYNTSATRIERSIRHAIEVAWSRNASAVFNTLFSSTGFNFEKKLTNSEFIALIADNLKLKNKEKQGF